MTEWDFPKLKDLITEIDTGAFDIELTGFDEMELKNIFDYDKPPTDPKKEWIDMPEFIHEDKRPIRTIFVHFFSETALNKFSQTIKQKITEKTKYINYE